jgi:hypothetical protein
MKTKTLFLLCLLLGIATTQLFSQTLKKGAVIAVNTYTFTLKPDVKMDQFIDFYVNKYIPEFEKNYPGVKEFLLTGNRGEKKNQIGVIDYFESVAIRDKYYPIENDTTMNAVVKAAEEKMKSVNEEVGKFFVPGSTRVYTDWLIK